MNYDNYTPTELQLLGMMWYANSHQNAPDLTGINKVTSQFNTTVISITKVDDILYVRFYYGENCNDIKERSINAENHVYGTRSY